MSTYTTRWTVIGLVAGLIIGLYDGAQWYSFVIVALATAIGFSVGCAITQRRRRVHVIEDSYIHCRVLPHDREAA